jgi:hypothetical protein
VPDSKDAQSQLADIISEAKLANAIVVDMLEFVRPIRLEVEHTLLTDVLHQAVTLAETKAKRGDIVLTVSPAAESPGDRRGLPPALSGVHEPADERVRGDGGPRRDRRHRLSGRDGRGSRSRARCARVNA